MASAVSSPAASAVAAARCKARSPPLRRMFVGAFLFVAVSEVFCVVGAGVWRREEGWDGRMPRRGREEGD
jgi:hypothetical protein